MHTLTPLVGQVEPSVAPYVNIPVSWASDHLKYLKTSSLHNLKISRTGMLLVDTGGFGLQQ
jgi:hypothetical protein